MISRPVPNLRMLWRQVERFTHACAGDKNLLRADSWGAVDKWWDRCEVMLASVIGTEAYNVHPNSKSLPWRHHEL